MDFNYLSSRTNKLVNATLHGIEAHKLLSPAQRIHFNKFNIPNTAKQAGVLVLVYPNQNNKACILLTKRAMYKGKHSQEISFPGGKRNKEDLNLKNTAIRETFEEVGLPIKTINIQKELTSVYIPTSDFNVSAYLATTSYLPVFSLSHEVETVISLDVEDLLNPKSLTSFIPKTSYTKQVAVPCFKIGNHYIWGATAMILNEVKEVLKKL